ncbi:TPA: hypothetical protein H1005_00585 [archaeon]|uniref:Uncharacterized protein n=1 Tax=Candidatus Naiadarchaeum limnaeum TaxID=2756139 RepID=A0A832UP61_9ARCH|nr:hypothetical protein [Candidatus Naiadarchaeales archaeon SRR2090153.bin1042]HIK00839.1 hypothetical protein [Candidatus Naiadarchaeum limnaeum]
MAIDFLQKAEETFSTFINWAKSNKLGQILREESGIFAFVCEKKPASWTKAWMPLRVIISAYDVVDPKVLDQINSLEKTISEGKPARSVVLCGRFDHAALMLKPKNVAFYVWNPAREKWIHDSDCWSDPVFEEFLKNS